MLQGARRLHIVRGKGMAEIHTYSVTEMNRLIKNLVEGSGRVTNVQVRGEISNFKRYPSGHCYFSLKDSTGVLKCVMFRRQASHLLQDPVNGDTVVAVGSIGIYERDGVYQLYTDLLIAEGTGDLMQAYENLKNKLAAEGLFSEQSKKKLPEHPQTVGIITSPAGAAVRDVITVSRRRDPGVQLLLYPVQVQGKAAAGEIAKAIRFMNRHRLADVLIVGRGGGSMEDLWAFNEEIVVRAIAASEIPLISSVGHETDFTLSDFAADKRAATPSQAAELAVADTGQYRRQIERERQKLEKAVLRMLQERTRLYQKAAASRMLQDPLRIIDRAEERLDRTMEKLRRSLPVRIENREFRLQQAIKVLKRPDRILEKAEQRFTAVQNAFYNQASFPEGYETQYRETWRRGNERIRELLRSKEQKLALQAAGLQAVSPLNVLARGYSVTLNEQGELLKSVSAARWGEEICTRLNDGKIYSVIQQIERQDDDGR